MPKVSYPKIPYICEGPLGGSENVMGYTPKGARYFLEYIKSKLWCNVELTLTQLSHLPPEERRGIWTVDFQVSTSFNDESLWKSDIW